MSNPQSEKNTQEALSSNKPVPAPTAPVPPPPTRPDQHDDTDVANALARKTSDGPGKESAPDSDFQSFATMGVEKEELLSVQDVASQVLGGRWGSSQVVAEKRLKDAGYDTDAVNREVARRKVGGAPSAF